ncbi:MAG TPA: hypothetical protein VGC06_22195 [Actinomycetes bacterium]
MPGRWWTDDDRLLEALGEALRVGPVPENLVEAAKRAYAAHDIDAQFAALIYDSAEHDQAELVATRSEPASLRAMSFSSGGLTIEIEITDDAILGQLLPPGAGVVNVQLAKGEGVTVPVDDAGGFMVRPIPSSSFRLHCRTIAGISALTDWIAL